MMNYSEKVLIFLVGLITGGSLTTIDYTGTEFLLTFTKNLYSTGNLFILLSSEQNVDVIVRDNLNEKSTTHAVFAGTPLQVELSTTALRYTADNAVTNTSVYIVSTFPINVHTLNYYYTSSDGYHALPISALSTEYIAVSYTVTSPDQALIVFAAIADDTRIGIKYRVADGGECNPYKMKNGYETSFFLNRFEVDGTYCTGDVTGTVITSNKPITVLVGHKCVKVPNDKDGCDKLEEMLPPTNSWGKSFVLYDLMGRQSGGLYRVVAKDNNTTIAGSCGANITMGKGDFYEIDTAVTGQHCIYSNNPVMVALLAKGKYAVNADGYGDPFLSVIPSTCQYLRKTFVNYQFNLTIPMKYYVTVLVHKNDLTSLSKEIQDLAYTIPSCDYVVATLEQTSQNLPIENEKKVYIAAMMYGLGTDNAVGFGYNLGMTLDTDDCQSAPCLNNGTCQDGTYSYLCQCRDKYTGSICESEITIDDCSTTCVIDETSQTIEISCSENETASSTFITSTAVETDILSTFITSTAVESDILSTFITSTAVESDILSTFITSTAVESDILSTFITSTAVESDILSTSISPTAVQTNILLTLISPSAVQTVTVDASSTTSYDVVIKGSMTSATSLLRTTSVCSCSCIGKKADTKESASVVAEEIRQHLSVNVSTLRRTVLKRISVNDQRPSAQTVGSIGMISVFIVVGLVIIPDVLSIFKFIHHIYTEQMKQCKAKVHK